jgi:hypothetical protein
MGVLGTPMTALDTLTPVYRHDRGNESVRHTYTSVGHSKASVGHTKQSVRHTHASVRHTHASLRHTHASVRHTQESVRHAARQSFSDVKLDGHDPANELFGLEVVHARSFGGVFRGWNLSHWLAFESFSLFYRRNHTRNYYGIGNFTYES